MTANPPSHGSGPDDDAATDAPAAPPVDPGIEAARGGLANRLARGASIAGAGFVLTRGLTLTTYLVVANLIVPRDSGQLAAAQVLLGFGFVFAESGMLSALIHWKGDVDRAASTATVSSLATGVLLSLLGLATAPLIGLFFQSSTIGWVAAASSGLMLLRSIQIVPDALLQRQFAFVRRVTVDPLGAVAHLVVSVVACAAGMGVWGLLLGQYAMYLTQAIAAWGLLKWRPQRRLVDWATFRQLAGYARHIVSSEVIRRSTAELDSVLLGRVTGAGALGQYAYGLRIAGTPIDAWVTIGSYALMPAFSRMSDDLVRFRRAFTEVLAVMLTVGFPIALVLAVTGSDLALMLFGPEWARSGDAIQALAGAGLGQMLTSIASETYKGAGRPQLLARTHLITAGLSVICLPALLILFEDDVLGIALAVSLVAVLTGLYAIRTAAKLIGASLVSAVASLRGLLAATAVALLAVLAFDSVAFTGSGRAAATGSAIADTIVIALVYAAATRLFAPAQFNRLAEAVGRIRRRT